MATGNSETIIDVAAREVPSGNQDENKAGEKKFSFAGIFGGSKSNNPMLKFLGVAIFSFILLQVIDVYEDSRARRKAKANLDSIEYEKKIAEIKSSTPTVTAAKPVMTQVKPEPAYATVDGCRRSSEGLPLESIQTITGDTKFTIGCTTFETSFPVKEVEVEGANFVIEAPDGSDMTKSWKCTAAPKCAEHINYYRDGKAGVTYFRIIVKGGSVIIRH